MAYGVSHSISIPKSVRKFGALPGPALSFVLSGLFEIHKKLFVVCQDQRELKRITSELQVFLGSEAPIFRYPDTELLPFESVSPDLTISAERLDTLHRIRHFPSWLTLTTPNALMQRVLPSDLIDLMRIRLSLGMHLDRDRLIAALDLAGFTRVSLVEGVGEFAVRGGVVDAYYSANELPVRIELLGGKITRLKTFNHETQKSIVDIAQIEIGPVREYINLALVPERADLLARVISNLRSRIEELEVPGREISRWIDSISEGRVFPGIELGLYSGLGKLESVTESFTADTSIVFCNHPAIARALDAHSEIIAERAARFAAEHSLIPRESDLYSTAAESLAELARFPTIQLDQLELLDLTDQNSSPHKSIRTASNSDLTLSLRGKVGGQRPFLALSKFIERWRELGFRLAFVIGAESRLARLEEILRSFDLDCKRVHRGALNWIGGSNPYPIVLIEGEIESGLKFLDQKLIVVAEQEIFHERSHRRSGVTTEKTLKRIITALAQLAPGHHVVHEDYGVGLYRGLQEMQIEHIRGEFLQIDYSDSRLYVPVQQIGKLQRFIGVEGSAPELDRLGSNRWTKTKQKVRDSVVALAGDLIKLYALRESLDGFGFEADAVEETQFADGFPYNETPDQLAAIESTLNDMAANKPMDRLVCGDVGFGKTEVALRAAFRCVSRGKQVAVLVPTTILAEQHGSTFAARFARYPVETRVLSRFYPPVKNRETLAGVASGQVDIVIGTHKLLQRNVAFKDLGLLIIDEEHRFGVKQKERLKRYKTQLDVLTLTATPIPRTMHMALLGIRDISAISTPPHDRKLIRTYVATESDVLVRDALIRELQRGGQSFFVHNRVETIAVVCERLAQLVPEARFEFAHGQMSEVELEKIMHRFIERKIDVLCCTAIIESGLDIPNANTIIIDRADTFGLAQLYQLRGRVGRSDRQAYAYLLIPTVRGLGATAERRLKVLQSLDDLGVGFNLALSDLEIRGAGNLLGKEQSGNVIAVGYELYSKILKQTVLNLQGEELPIGEAVDPEVKLGIEAFIPESYLPDISERLVLYQRLAAIRESHEADELREEIVDRFGPLSPEVKNLVEIMRFRGLLRRFGVELARRRENELMLSFSSLQRPRRNPQDTSLQSTTAITIGKSGSVTIALSESIWSDPQLLYQRTEEVLSALCL